MAEKQNKGNRQSTSTKPKAGTKADKRLSENRSSNYPAGSRTRQAGSPTNQRKAGTRKRVG